MTTLDQPSRSRRKSTKAAKQAGAGNLIAKLRKPIAPPTRVEDDHKYQRARENERLRREGGK